MSASPSAALDAGLDLARDTAALLVESWSLSLESAAVIWLRLGKLAALDASALAEGELMLGEKVQAAVEHSWRLASGGFGLTPHRAARGSVAFYRRQVAANRRRLSRREG
ncbi:hypothetical protein H7F50_10735 [Novosphingobium flavum]|uniref:hypothetical protein n=1 Tax=Novosphingobium aerophilum TaxID=2839843 RepID=UPI00163A5008|nr:hypothetical protein [Novosphingobium aerophilum]MBC2662234.1 hypothetical protein [Novosphingobium aerophilum]